MSAALRRLAGILISALLETVALAGPATAVQLGGTLGFDTGPAAWDQADARDPLLDGSLGASYQLPRVAGLQPELLGAFGLSSRPEQRAAVGWDIGARFHTGGSAGGVWVGAAIGAAGTWNSRSELSRLEAGVRRSVGPARINVWLSRTGFGAAVAPEPGLGQDSGSTDSLPRKSITEYTDLGSRVTLGLSRYEVALSFIQRLGGATIRRTGWELSGTWWMAPGIGLAGSTGHSLSQFGLTVPGARYGTVGLRLAVGSRSPTERIRDRTSEAKPVAGPTVATLRRQLTVRSAPARLAEVMGDFTDWKAEPLVAMGTGQWMLPRALSPGIHHLNVRFDGGAWLVPSGTVAVDDGYGGRAGILVVR